MIQTILVFLFLIFVVTLVTNVAFMTLKLGIKIPYKKKQFKLKYNPIYKMERISAWDVDCTINKYKLMWFTDSEIAYNYFIPFAGLIKLYRYADIKTPYGKFTKKQIESGVPRESLEFVWENLHKTKLRDGAEKKAYTQRFQKELDSKNKIFTENYEK